MDKITAYMASFPDRAHGLPAVVASLWGQVDRLHVWLNNFNRPTIDWLKQMCPQENVIFHDSNILLQNKAVSDIGDAGKFFQVKHWEGYVLTVDDDIMYPENYVDTMIDRVEEHKRQAVVSCQGRVFDGSIKTYNDNTIRRFGAFRYLPDDHPCDMLGTGAMCLHTDVFNGVPVSFSVFTHTNCSDILFSAELKRRGIPMIAVRHESRWLTEIRYPKKIATRLIDDDKIEVQLINSLLICPQPCTL